MFFYSYVHAPPPELLRGVSVQPLLKLQSYWESKDTGYLLLCVALPSMNLIAIPHACQFSCGLASALNEQPCIYWFSCLLLTEDVAVLPPF